MQIGGQSRQFSLATDRILRIGRSDKSDLPLIDDLASRHHAMLQQSDGHFYITDLGSSNGTLVNGVRIATPVILRPGDRIGIGHHEFTFHQNIFLDDTAGEPLEGMSSTNILFAESLITVLVADIRDFTGLSQRLDAPMLSKLTGTLFRETGKALQDQGAWAQKYIGDTVMAVWRHKQTGPEFSDLIPVFEGLGKLLGIAAGMQERLGLAAPVRFGAAVNTGWASVGNVGSIASADHTALGETVNRAFRLESSTREIAKDLVIGQDTFAYLNSGAPMTDLFAPVTVHLKGYAEPVKAYASDFAAFPDLLQSLRSAASESK